MIQRSDYMGADELQRVLNVARGWAAADLAAGRRQGVLAWAVFDTITQTGMRPTEIAAMRNSDLISSRKALRVRTAKRRATTKPASLDEIAVSGDLVRHLAEFTAWKATVGESIEPDAPLFIGQRGPLTIKGVSQLVKGVCQRAGLGDFNARSARHTYAVTLLAATGNLRLVQKQLRHRRIETTTVYADVRHEQITDVLDKIFPEPKR